MSALLGFILLFLIFGAPFFLTYDICKSRNRNVAKGLFVTFFFGWLATIGLWLGLKTRSADRQRLY